MPSCRFRDRAQILDNSKTSASASRGSRALLRPRVRYPRLGVTRSKGSIPSWASSLSRVFTPPAVEMPSHLLRSWPSRRRPSSEEPVTGAGLQRVTGQEARLASFESCRPA
jgi:hypothetical protein